MARVRTEIVVDASPQQVWEAIEDVSSHTEWMEDAEAIRFHGDQRQGVGTSYECDTVVGPLRLTDHMEVTRWEPNEAMGVRHTGIVTGEGMFTISPTPDGQSLFRWDEELTFPWWMGARVGSAAGAQVLKRIWAKNLANLKAKVESETATESG